MHVPLQTVTIGALLFRHISCKINGASSCCICVIRLACVLLFNTSNGISCNFMNVNVNGYVYSLMTPWVQQPSHNLHPWYWSSLIYTVISLWGEFSICALCCSYSQSLQFSYLVPPDTITTGWTEVAWNERLAQQLYTWPTANSVAMCYHLCGSCDQTSSPLFGSSSLVVYDMSTDSALCSSVDCSATFSPGHGIECWASTW